MSIDNNILHALLAGSKDGKVPASASPIKLDMEQESREFLCTVRSAIEHELLVTAVVGRDVADSWWTLSRHSMTMSETEPTYLGTRVRIKNGSLQCEWFRNSVRSEGSSKQVFSRYLPKGKGFRYPSHRFKKEPAWARELVEIVESDYEIVRKRASILSSITRALREYEALINKTFTGSHRSSEPGVSLEP